MEPEGAGPERRLEEDEEGGMREEKLRVDMEGEEVC